MPHQAENAMRLMFTDYQNGNATAEPNVRCFTSEWHTHGGVEGIVALCETKDVLSQSFLLSLTSQTFSTPGANPRIPRPRSVAKGSSRRCARSAPVPAPTPSVQPYPIASPIHLLSLYVVACSRPVAKTLSFSLTSLWVLFFQVLLHCWVESNREDAADRAEVHFRQMKAQFLEGDEAMRPDCISYSILLNTFAQKMQIEAAEDMLWEMVEDYLDGNKAAEPRTRKLNPRSEPLMIVGNIAVRH